MRIGALSRSREGVAYVRPATTRRVLRAKSHRGPMMSDFLDFSRIRVTTANNIFPNYGSHRELRNARSIWTAQSCSTRVEQKIGSEQRKLDFTRSSPGNPKVF